MGGTRTGRVDKKTLLIAARGGAGWWGKGRERVVEVKEGGRLYRADGRAGEERSRWVTREPSGHGHSERVLERNERTRARAAEKGRPRPISVKLKKPQSEL